MKKKPLTAEIPGSLRTAHPDDGVTSEERIAIVGSFARFDSVALGVAFGAVCGVGLWVATAALLLQGGVWVGYHLGRLSNFLIGYRVSWPGSFVGLVEGAVIGFLLGWVFASLWNAYHHLFVKIVVARERNRSIRRELQYP